MKRNPSPIPVPAAILIMSLAAMLAVFVWSIGGFK